MDLVLGARARPHELRPARQSAPHRADPLVGHPDRVELPRPEQLRERAGVEAVSLRPRLADAGVRRRDDDHARDVRLQDARNLPGVAGHLERHVVLPVEALREQLERLGLRLDPAARAQLTMFRRSPPRRSRGGRPAPLLSIPSSSRR